MTTHKNVNTAFARMMRGGLIGHPDTVRKRMGDMQCAMKRAITESTDPGFLALCTELEAIVTEEIQRYERQKSNAWKAYGPTPETARKASQNDTIRALLTKGTITAEDEDAVDEIRELRERISGWLGGGGGDVHGERVDTSRKTFTHPIERLSKRQELILKHVYRPWVKVQDAENIRVGARGREIPLTPFGLVCLIIDGEATLRGLEKKFSLNQSAGELGKELSSALSDFTKRLTNANGKVPRRGK